MTKISTSPVTCPRIHICGIVTKDYQGIQNRYGVEMRTMRYAGNPQRIAFANMKMVSHPNPVGHQPPNIESQIYITI